MLLGVLNHSPGEGIADSYRIAGAVLGDERREMVNQSG